MFNIKVSTAAGRRTIIAEPGTTVRDFIANNDIETTGANISLDGIPMTFEDFNSSFEDLGVTDSAVLSIIIKTHHA